MNQRQLNENDYEIDEVPCPDCDCLDCMCQFEDETEVNFEDYL